MNIFVGCNLGNNVFKIGLLCLVGVAHLPEHLGYLEYKDSFDIRPSISTNIMKEVNSKLIIESTPTAAIPIIGNLVHAIKLISSKVLPLIPVSGNVKFEDGWD